MCSHYSTTFLEHLVTTKQDAHARIIMMRGVPHWGRRGTVRDDYFLIIAQTGGSGTHHAAHAGVAVPPPMSIKSVVVLGRASYLWYSLLSRERERRYTSLALSTHVVLVSLGRAERERERDQVRYKHPCTCCVARVTKFNFSVVLLASFHRSTKSRKASVINFTSANNKPSVSVSLSHCLSREYHHK
jgi:hypothetical protein